MENFNPKTVTIDDYLEIVRFKSDFDKQIARKSLIEAFVLNQKEKQKDLY